jgi:hypothetical protein
MKKTLLTAVGALFLAASLGAGAQISVRIGPPPRRVERRPPPPVGRRDWAWRAGYNRWDGAHYVWVPGEYIAPPRRGVRWVDGRWVRSGGGWVWMDGRWR